MVKSVISVLMTTGLLLGSVVAVGAVVGLTLPETHEQARSARLAAPPSKVYALITDVAQYPEWRTDVSKVEILPDDGEGLRFTEYSDERTDAIRYRIEEASPPSRLKIRVDDDSLPFGGTWTYLLQPFEDGTSVTITENGRIRNPLFRVVAKVLFSPTDAMDRYLHDLAQVEGIGRH
jgi:uncharacterized protein YndB with AHSA1/START domain